MISKVATALWFARRPSFWAHGVALAQRKFLPDYDTPELRRSAREWASQRACSVDEALEKIGFGKAIPALDPAVLQEARVLAARPPMEMGGAGDLRLLHAATLLSDAISVIETGVAYGWSSLAILAALRGRAGARLVSIDMPYPKMGNEAYVGVVVPSRLREPWILIREPDRHGLRKGLAVLGGTIDLCHYDSDKSWWGRQYAYPLLWAALRRQGIFISDDIQDNFAFAHFMKAQGAAFAITECEGKFVGIARKN